MRATESRTASGAKQRRGDNADKPLRRDHRERQDAKWERRGTQQQREFATSPQTQTLANVSAAPLLPGSSESNI